MDSEFFRPDYVEAEERVRKCNVQDLGRLGGFVPGPFGSAFHVENYDFKSPYRYIRGQDVKPFFVLAEDERYIPKADFLRLGRYAVRTNDLMISVVGTLGNVAVCTPHETPAMFSCKSTLFRTQSADPYYLLAYLNSEGGQMCILRRQRGAIQGGLNIEDLRTIPVPRFEGKVESTIAASIKAAHGALIASRDNYSQALHLLGSELGLDNLTFQKTVGYTPSFSELETSRRFDAQHYQPRFSALRHHLTKFPISRFRDIRTYNHRGVQPVYVAGGEIAVVNSQHLGPKHINYDGLDRTTLSAFQASPEAHIRKDDLLLYSTGAYVGRTNVYLLKAPAQASNHVNILRLVPEVDAAYMAVVFQSVVGQFQTQNHSRGSAQAELYPADIDRFVVPLLDPKTQRRIGDLVRESLAKEQESKALLAQAKQRVEELIQQAIK